MTESKDKKKAKESKKAEKTALETAYAYLSGRMRTTSEMEKHLKEKGFGEDEIRETVNDLIGLRYLDDYQYALRYYEYNHEKRRGQSRAARELAAKGVDQETIRNAGEDFAYSNSIDEFEDALFIARRELELKNVLTADDKMSAAIARRLENRGFSRDIIFRVLERLRSSAFDD